MWRTPDADVDCPISYPACFPFQVTYPLDGRGVVLLRGSNLDDSGADSNGSGKTTLAMSALWAMAGVVDARCETIVNILLLFGSDDRQTRKGEKSPCGCW